MNEDEFQDFLDQVDQASDMLRSAGALMDATKAWCQYSSSRSMANRGNFATKNWFEMRSAAA